MFKRQNSIVPFLIPLYLISVLGIFFWLQSTANLNTEALKLSDFIAAAIAIGSALISAIATILAYKSLKLTEQAEEFSRKAETGQLYLKMMERYSAKEMADALRLLGQFKAQNKLKLKSAIAQWKIDLDLKKDYAVALENARHRVKYFYRDLMQLHQAGYFDTQLTKRILNPGGRYLFKDLVLEMEPQINPLQFKNEFGDFSSLHKELVNELTPSFSEKKPLRKVCLIPARYDAIRYPGKLLKPLGGKTVVRYTYENVASMGLFDYVAVVTNSDEIREEIESYGGNVIYNQTSHPSGTDRIAEAVQSLDADIIVNVQGDEPFVRKEPLADMINSINPDINDMMVASLMRPMDDRSHIASSDYVKVVCDNNNYALYFSRSVLPLAKKTEPAATYYEHIGVYAFTRKALLAFASLQPTLLEQIESIECLRYLENSIPIKMVETKYLILEIDTEADLVRAEKLINDGTY